MFKIFKQKNVPIALSLIVFACAMRLSLPPLFGHLPNVSPIAAIAIFSGVMFQGRWTGLLFTFICIALSDFVVNNLVYQQFSIFYSGFYWQYACYFLMCLMGYQLKNHLKLINLAYAGFASAVLFYLVSNFGVWLSSIMYPKTWEGLIACYIAAIPFFKNSLASNLVFTSMLYATYCLVFRDKRALQV